MRTEKAPAKIRRPAPLAVACPDIFDHCITAHVFAEPGHARLLRPLALTPLLSLGLRLGEASGPAVAITGVRSAVSTHAGMGTFAEAGVSQCE